MVYLFSTRNIASLQSDTMCVLYDSIDDKKKILVSDHTEKTKIYKCINISKSI